MSRTRPLFLVTLTLGLISGCGSERPKPDPTVPIENVPPKVVETAKKALPDLEFDQVFKMNIEGKDAYEFRGKDKQGRIREVEVSATGELLGIE